MIEGKCPVIQRARIGKGIFRVKQCHAQPTRDGKHARQANRAQRFETIGILDNFGLDTLRRNTRAETVRLDGVLHAGKAIRRKVREIAVQNVPRFARRQTR